MRYLQCLIILISVTGCSYVTRDYYFYQGEQGVWKSDFIKASQPSVKHVPIPDKSFNTFESDGVTIKVWTGYTVLKTTGIWPLPIVPVGALDKEKLVVHIQIGSNEDDVIIDLKSIELVDLSNTTNLKYSAQEVTVNGREKVNLSESLALKKGETKEILLVSNVSAKKLSEILLKISDIRSGDKVIEVHQLKLKKKSGSFNYDELTV